MSLSSLRLALLPLAFAVTLTACSGGDTPGDEPASPSTSASASAGASEAVSPEEEAEAITAAKKTLVAFFSEASSPLDTLSDKIDAQEKYLTERAAHPSAEFEDPSLLAPMGVEEVKTVVKFSTAGYSDGTVAVDFTSTVEGNTHRVENEEVVEGSAEPFTNEWAGSASLVEVDGEWLISTMTISLAQEQAPGKKGNAGKR